MGTYNQICIAWPILPPPPQTIRAKNKKKIKTIYREPDEIVELVEETIENSSLPGRWSFYTVSFIIHRTLYCPFLIESYAKPPKTIFLRPILLFSYPTLNPVDAT